HRDLVAAQLAKLRGRQADEVGSLEPHRAAGDAPRRLGHKTHDAVGRDALAAATLADDAKGASGEERKADAVDGAELAVISGEMRAQLADLEERRRAVALGRERLPGGPLAPAHGVSHRRLRIIVPLLRRTL